MNAIVIARQMEMDAIEFYTEAAQKTRHPVGKKMFETVAGDEKRHLEIVSALIKGLDINAGDIHAIEEIRTVFEQMKDEMMHKVEVTSDELEAFKIAMKMEIEGAEFYKKLLSEAISDKEKTLFQKLIKEEEQHYEIFANTYNFLDDTENWFMWEEHSIVEG